MQVCFNLAAVSHPSHQRHRLWWPGETCFFFCFVFFTMEGKGVFWMTFWKKTMNAWFKRGTSKALCKCGSRGKGIQACAAPPPVMPFNYDWDERVDWVRFRTHPSHAQGTWLTLSVLLLHQRKQVVNNLLLNCWHWSISVTCFPQTSVTTQSREFLLVLYSPHTKLYIIVIIIIITIHKIMPHITSIANITIIIPLLVFWVGLHIWFSHT